MQINSWPNFSEIYLKFFELIYLPFNAFLVFPPLAIIIGLAFFAICRGRVGDRGAAVTAAVLWLAYGVYECFMSWVWSPAHVAPIRADLLLFAPILYLISLYAIFSLWSQRKNSISK